MKSRFTRSVLPASAVGPMNEEHEKHMCTRTGVAVSAPLDGRTSQIKAHGDESPFTRSPRSANLVD